MSPQRSNGTGSVWRKANGIWEAALYVNEADGARRRRRVYGKTKAEALRKLDELRREVASGTPITPRHLTLGAYLQEWLNQVAAPRVRASTLTAYRHSVNRYLTPGLGDVPLGRLTAREVRLFLDALLKDGIGARTARYVHSTLRAALEDAMREELIGKNVAKLVRAPSVPKAERRPLAVDEVRMFLKANQEDRLFALLVVLALLGVRRSEALGLQWQDVDLADGTMTIRRGLHRVDGKLRTLEPKTARSRRTIPLPTMVVRALLEHGERQDQERRDLDTRWHESGYIFTTPIGTPLDPDNISKFVKKALVTAGVREVHMHDLRHGCASVLLAQGIPPRTVMEILGHSSLEMTMNVYGHVSLDDKKSALDRLGSLFEEEQ